ncbi:MAG: SLC13 family permease [Miltoncostaeaceae bacterium]
MEELIAIVLFLVVIGIVASEKIHRTKIALAGAAVVVLFGLIDSEHAIEAIDWEVLGLLAGMMILVWGAEQSGAFTYAAIRVGQMSRGRPASLIFGLTAATAVMSAFLDNVTTVLLVVPITFVIADALDLDPIPLVIAEVIASNIGGAATLIGDPPNIIIAGASGLGFNEFLINVGPPAVVAYVLVTIGLYFAYRKQLNPDPSRVLQLDSLDPKASLGPKRDVVTILVILGLTIIGFFLHQPLHIEPATIALSGAALFLLVGRLDIEKPLEAIEWPTLFFFVGLFVMVGALEVNGTLDRIAEWLADTTEGDKTAEVLGIAWLSAIASGFVDNIPFTAAMAPVVDRLSEDGDDTSWWALSIGACYGGNLTLIAASANLVASGAVSRAGRKLSFGRFLKIGIPATFVSMLIGTGWLLILLQLR